MIPDFLNTKFVLIDAARIGRSLSRLQQLAVESRCLFRGESEARLGPLAPHLMDLGPRSFPQNPVLQSGWGESWGVYVNADCSLEALWRHFRKFLFVKTEAGREFYFRFYDPRVLRLILPVFDEEQLRDFFGPVKEFILEDDDPAFALRFSIQSGGTPAAERHRVNPIQSPSRSPGLPFAAAPRPAGAVPPI